MQSEIDTFLTEKSRVINYSKRGFLRFKFLMWIKIMDWNNRTLKLKLDILKYILYTS